MPMPNIADVIAQGGAPQQGAPQAAAPMPAPEPEPKAKPKKKSAKDKRHAMYGSKE